MNLKNLSPKNNLIVLRDIEIANLARGEPKPARWTQRRPGNGPRPPVRRQGDEVSEALERIAAGIDDTLSRIVVRLGSDRDRAVFERHGVPMHALPKGAETGWRPGRIVRPGKGLIPVVVPR